MKITADTIDRFFYQFLDTGRKPVFQRDEIIQYIIARTDAGKDDFDRIERNVDMLLQGDSGLLYDVEKASVARRSALFFGARFRIVPTVLELQNNVLIPGDRFAPFCNSEVFPDEYMLFGQGSRKQFEIVPFSASFGSIIPIHTFLGRSGIYDLVVAESEENRRRLHAAHNPIQTAVEISAFDLSDFYLKNHFRFGDAVIVTVEDWGACKFSLEYRPKEIAPSKSEMFDWIAAFEEALLRVCDLYEDFFEIPEQFAYGFFFASENGHNLLNEPVVSAEEYYLNMTDITIHTDTPEWYLVSADSVRQAGSDDSSCEHDRDDHPCTCNHDHDDHPCTCGHDHNHAPVMKPGQEPKSGEVVPGLSGSDFSVSTGKIDSLDAILADVNAPIGTTELFAMVLDSIGNSVSFEAFRASILDRIDQDFADDAQEVAFLNFLEENWEYGEEIYRPSADADKMPYRTRLLDLDEQRIEFSKQLLSSNNQARLQEITPKLRHFHKSLIETLALLNTDDELPDGEEREQLSARIDDLEDLWDDIALDSEV